MRYLIPCFLLCALVPGSAWADADLSSPATATTAAAAEPFAFGDFTWVPGNSRTHLSPLTGPAFVGEFRIDAPWHYNANAPVDHTISGSSEVFRHGELQVTQIGAGGDFHYGNAHGRLMTQFGMYSETTARNDASAARGQWQLDNAYRYVSEAYGGYHFDVLNGINIQAGIFMSYIGLWSYYNADNWTYQPSYVSSNTPWFFNGVRAQIFLTDKLKIEPWLVNGWQSYGTFNNSPGGGGQILWRPTSYLSFVSNNYYGADTLGNPDRKRWHTDDSMMVKYYENKGGFISKAAMSLTVDAGCETGGGVSCMNGTAAAPSQYFVGFMAYNRLWFNNDHFGLTLGGGAIKNPGRYLVLVPPINGATAYSGVSPNIKNPDGSTAFSANPGDPFTAWDTQVTFDWMPVEFVTFRLEYNHRAASIPYFSGHGGVTPPNGSGSYVNQGSAGSEVKNPDGTSWMPDLSKTEDRATLALMLKL